MKTAVLSPLWRAFWPLFNRLQWSTALLLSRYEMKNYKLLQWIPSMQYHTMLIQPTAFYTLLPLMPAPPMPAPGVKTLWFDFYPQLVTEIIRAWSQQAYLNLKYSARRVYKKADSLWTREVMAFLMKHPLSAACIYKVEGTQEEKQCHQL